MLADRFFLRNMLNDAWKASWWKTPFYSMLAWRYYRAVRALGAFAFTYRTAEELEALTLEQLRQEAEHGNDPS